MSKLYKYKAWLIDDHGVAVEGIEEEILTSSHSKAIRLAWDRAVKFFKFELDGGRGTIRMDYVHELDREIGHD